VEYRFPYEDLEIWTRAKLFTRDVYQLSKKFPEEERYGLTCQIRRAAVSICSNIAEGAARFSKKDQAYYIQLAYGSLMETLCQIELGLDLGYLDREELDVFRNDAGHLARTINAYHRALINR
jgi:four helix bundle protein